MRANRANARRKDKQQRICTPGGFAWYEYDVGRRAAYTDGRRCLVALPDAATVLGRCILVAEETGADAVAVGSRACLALTNAMQCSRSHHGSELLCVNTGGRTIAVYQDPTLAGGEVHPLFAQYVRTARREETWLPHLRFELIAGDRVRVSQVEGFSTNVFAELPREEVPAMLDSPLRDAFNRWIEREDQPF